MKPYKSVKQCSEVEYTVNRSRFIGRCFPVDSEEAALCLLSDIRKRHWDATHNCFAYRIGETAAAARFSDDGEPGGTAGKPIMDVLTGKGLTNVLCVVTRYFGGILLGAGGLVRAYSKSAADAVTKAGMVSYLPGTILDIPMDYSRYGTLEGFIRANAEVQNVVFAENVVVTAAVEDANLLKFMKEVTERSDGRCTPVTIGTGYMKKDEI
ncbi:MAG: YigZ family protein [Christensenellales bacterium]